MRFEKFTSEARFEIEIQKTGFEYLAKFTNRMASKKLSSALSERMVYA